jgi:hypothetical protein
MTACLADVAVGGVVAVYNTMADQHQVLRRTCDGWKVELACDATLQVHQPMRITAQRLFLAHGPLDAAACWLRDMHTERMLKVEVRTER